MKADCIDEQTVQLKFVDELTLNYALASVLTVNDSILEVHFTIPAMQDCTAEISLVDGNGNVNDIRFVDCGLLLLPV